MDEIIELLETAHGLAHESLQYCYSGINAEEPATEESDAYCRILFIRRNIYEALELIKHKKHKEEYVEKASREIWAAYHDAREQAWKNYKKAHHKAYEIFEKTMSEEQKTRDEVLEKVERIREEALKKIGEAIEVADKMFNL